MIILDANYILRFLLKDDLKMYEIAKDTIISNECMILNEVLAEVVFVLLKVYNIEKKIISETLINFIQQKNILVEDKQVLINSFNIFQSKNLDFIDSILCAKSKDNVIMTFDKKLNKYIQGDNNENI